MDIQKLIIAAGLLAAAAPAAAVPTAPNLNATGKALVLIPLTLTKIDDLRFGTIVPSSLSGAVIIDAATGGRTLVGGVAGVASDVGNRGYFAGGGSPGQPVVVTVTQPAQLTSVAGDTIPVLALTLQGSPIKIIDPLTRTFFFGVGGIILVNADQPEGIYDATFTVTANYQ